MLTRLCVSFFAFLVSLNAQTVSGTFVGQVTDSSQSIVPAAAVEFTDTQHGIVKKTVTSADGTYTLPYLQPGNYSVRISAPGFKTFERSGIELTLGASVRVNAQLEVGNASDSVTVTGSQTMLQTDRAEIARAIDPKAVVDLPRLGRNYQTTLLLIPGAGIPANYWNPENNYNSSVANGNSDTAVNGTPTSANSYLMDGVLNKENVLSTTMILPPPEAIGEVQITTSNYDAESGTVGGAMVNVVTRGGTNQYHGSAALFHNDSGLNAQNFFATRKPRQNRDQYVATVEGPVQHDQTFFFADFQGNNMRIGRAGALFTLPVDAFRQGNFSQARFPIYDPLTGNPDGSGRQAFAGNVIPADRLSPVAVNVLKNIPQPMTNSLANNFAQSTLFSLDNYATDVRVDHRFGSRTNLFVKYSYFQFNDTDPGIFGDFGGPSGSNTGVINISHGRNQGASINGTHTFSPTLLTEARIGFARAFSDANGPGWDKQTAAQLGISGVYTGDLHTTGGMPLMAISGFLNIGIPGQLPSNQITETYDIVNTWTKIHGRHTFKWGTDIRKIRGDLLQGNSGTRGTFTFSPSVTGSRGGPAVDSSNAFASFMLGLPDYVQRTVPLAFPTSIGYQYMFFGQDTWQVNSKLTLNIGLRYELWSAPGSRRPGGQANYQPQNNTVLVAGLGDVPLSAGVQWDKNNWAPRVGFAYRPRNKTVIRGGYGLSYFAHTFGFYGATLGGMYPSTINAAWGVLNDFLPEGNVNFVPFPTAPAVPANGIISPAPEQVYWFIPDNSQFPYVASWNTTVQQALPGDVSLEVSYVGNHGFHQPVQYDFNQSPPGTGAAGRQLFKAFGRTSVTNTRSTIKDSHYNSLQVLAKRQFHNGLYFQAAYTFSRALDNEQISSLWAPHNYDFGPTAGSAAHTFVFSHVYELPFGHGKKYLNQGLASHIVGNWALNGIFVAKTGNFFGVTADASALNAVSAANRPNVIRPVNYPDGIGPGTTWFDTTAFTRAAPLQFGNAGKNILVGPGLLDYDTSIFRNFAVRERFRMQFRGEFFNVLNTPHFNNPTASFDSPAFGTVSSAYGERRIQVGLKLQF
jgi:Carboxypeptidase regulatory-like domain/TonB dependent receptor-like, beta-barrel